MTAVAFVWAQKVLIVLLFSNPLIYLLEELRNPEFEIPSPHFCVSHWFSSLLIVPLSTGPSPAPEAEAGVALREECGLWV